MSRDRQAPVLIEWSPGFVRVVNTANGQTFRGSNIADAVGLSLAGRTAVVAISQRSAFIRAIPVPKASPDELQRIVSLKLPPLMPLGPGDYVSGYRLASDPALVGQLAVVGAIKSEALRAIYDDTEAARMTPVAVVPLAFGSWLASRRLHCPNCAVVQVRGDSLTIDLVASGELRYSRSVPLPPSEVEIGDAILQTFAVAGCAPSPTVALASPSVRADVSDDADSLSQLADVRSIDRLLFSLVLPERAAAKVNRSQRAAAGRAIVAAVIAVGFGLYVYTGQQMRTSHLRAVEKQASSQERTLQSDVGVAEQAADESDAEATVLERAFKPAQSFGDVVTVLSNSVNGSVWLTGLSLQRGQPLIVRGQATTGDAVSKLVAEIAKEPRFKGFKLLSAAKGSVGAKPVIQFALTGRAVGNLPLDQQGKTGGHL